MGGSIKALEGSQRGHKMVRDGTSKLDNEAYRMPNMSTAARLAAHAALSGSHSGHYFSTLSSITMRSTSSFSFLFWYCNQSSASGGARSIASSRKSLFWSHRPVSVSISRQPEDGTGETKTFLTEAKREKTGQNTAMRLGLYLVKKAFGGAFGGGTMS